jgi:hypothetical protein
MDIIWRGLNIEEAQRACDAHARCTPGSGCSGLRDVASSILALVGHGVLVVRGEKPKDPSRHPALHGEENKIQSLVPNEPFTKT